MSESVWRDHFSLDPERVWLNASHQGPLPDVAAEAFARMVEWKQQPFHLSTPEPFGRVPTELRSALAALLGAAPDGNPDDGSGGGGAPDDFTTPYAQLGADEPTASR